MSQISVLGFWSSSASFSSSSSGPSDHTHWAILISPHPPSAKPQKPKSKVKSKPRFFHSKITEPLSDSALFDMNKHQLRQQEFPIPLKEDADEADEADAPTSSPATSSEVLSITTLNADTSHPLQLTMRISASILADEPQRLIPKLSHRLYNTPTYGPEDDWLRAALSAMHDGFLEPGFDVDKFVEYAISAARDYAMYEGASEDQATRPAERTNVDDNTVLTLDYAAHISQNASVKAMLDRSPQSQSPPQQLTPPESPKLAQAQPQLQQQKKPRSWFGFRISTAHTAPPRRHTDRHRYSFERQDDPYGGLM